MEPTTGYTTSILISVRKNFGKQKEGHVHGWNSIYLDERSLQLQFFWFTQGTRRTASPASAERGKKFNYLMETWGKKVELKRLNVTVL